MALLLLLFHHILYPTTQASAAPADNQDTLTPPAHNVPESLEIQRNYSSMDQFQANAANPRPDVPLTPGGGWTSSMTWALCLFLLFAFGFAAFMIVPVIRKRMAKEATARKAKKAEKAEQREAATSVLGIQLAQTWTAGSAGSEEAYGKDASRSHSASAAIYGDKPTFGNAYEGLTTPKLRSLSGQLKSLDVERTDARKETSVKLVLKGDIRSSSEDLESRLPLRLAKRSQSMVLKEIVPLPPLQM